MARFAPASSEAPALAIASRRWNRTRSLSVGSGDGRPSWLTTSQASDNFRSASISAALITLGGGAGGAVAARQRPWTPSAPTRDSPRRRPYLAHAKNGGIRAIPLGYQRDDGRARTWTLPTPCEMVAPRVARALGLPRSVARRGS